MGSSRVNVRFVVILAAGITAAFGVVAVLAYQALTKSGEEYMAMGDRFLAEGDLQKASDSYAKAVAHDRTRIDWLKTWRDTLVQTTPDTDIEYEKAYSMYYSILETLAALQEYDPAPQRDYLDALMVRAEIGGAGADEWLRIADLSWDKHQRLGPGKPEVEALRRYRGLAYLNAMQMLPDRNDVREQALSDLQAAVKAAADMEEQYGAAWPEGWPASWQEDIEAGLGVVQWHALEWMRYRSQRQPERGEIEKRQAEQALAPMVAEHPSHPGVSLTALVIRLDQETVDLTPAERIEKIKALRGAEADVVRSFENTDLKDVDANMLERFRLALRMLRPDDFESVYVNTLDRLIGQNPNDPMMLGLRALALSRMDQRPRAIEQLQRIVDMPDLPVSLDGLILKSLRLQALYQIADNWVEIRGTEVGEAAKQAALDKAKEARNALASRLAEGENNRQVLMLDAKIAIAEDRHNQAQARLYELDNRLTPEDPAKPEVLTMLANSLERLGNVGAAREVLGRLLMLQPANVPAAMKLVQYHVRLNDFEEAMNLLDRTRHYAPDNAEIENLAKALRHQVEDTEADDIDDPVIRIVLDIDRLMNKAQPEYGKAVEVIEQGLKDNDEDQRLYGALLRVHVMQNDMEGIRSAIDRALAKYPDDQRFLDYRRRLQVVTAEDRIAAIIGLIDESDASIPTKLIRKHVVYLQNNMPEEAAAMLAEAVKVAPDDPSVLDAQFVNLLQNSKFEAARAIAEKARKLNVDEANGALYFARLALAQNDAQQAALALEQAREELPYDARVWRLLGQVRLQMGQADRAVEAFKNSYDYQPQDPETAQLYIQTLAALQRQAQALEIARDSHGRNPRSDALTELWLQLEEGFGDTNAALQYRYNEYLKNPDNPDNMVALGRLLLQRRQFTQAEEMLDFADGKFPNHLEFVTLRARLLGLQDQVDAGRERFLAYIHTIPAEDASSEPYLRLAQFLIEFGRVEQAMAAFDEAIRLQSPTEREADRMKAEYLFNTKKWAEALPHYEAIIAAGADTEDRIFTLRRIEAMQRLGRWDDAERALDEVGDSFTNDLRITLLRAEIARGREDLRTCADLLNKAVEQAPHDIRPYIKRAELNFRDPQQFQFVLKDLEKVIELDPTSVMARQMRGALYLRNGQVSDAVAEIRQGVAANPGSDQLRREFISLLVQTGRPGEAQMEAEKAIVERPNDPFWLVMAADIYETDEKYGQAADKYRAAYEAEPKNLMLAYRLARSLVKTAPPRSKEALDVIEALGTDADDHTRLLAVKARAQRQLGNRECFKTAERALLRAQDNAAIAEWFTHTQAMFPNDHDGHVAFMKSVTPPPTVTDMFLVEMGRLRLAPTSDVKGNPQATTQVHNEMVETLTQVKARATDPIVLVDCNRVLGTYHYAYKRYEEALKCFEDGAALKPDDLEFNNNAAYTLAKHMNKPQDALNVAQRAVDNAPGNAIALDTLGWIQFELKNYSQAQATLERAIKSAESVQDEDQRIKQVLPAKLHLAMVHKARGEKAEALALAKEVDRMLSLKPSMKAEYGSDYETLMNGLN